MRGVDAGARTHWVQPIVFVSPSILAFIGVHSRFNCSFLLYVCGNGHAHVPREGKNRECACSIVHRNQPARRSKRSAKAGSTDFGLLSSRVRGQRSGVRTSKNVNFGFRAIMECGVSLSRRSNRSAKSDRRAQSGTVRETHKISLKCSD